MTKKQAINIISKCATTYHHYLENYQVVFVYRDANNISHYAEVQFRAHNFLHFTGVIPRTGLNANNFYRYALNNKLSEKDFSFNNTHTSDLKLQILDTIMNIDTRARMIGNYNDTKLDLYTEKITGTTTACLGLIPKKDIYIPNTVLKEDIRTVITKPPGKIFAIFKKKISEKNYSSLTYKSNNITVTKNCIPKELVEQIENTLLNDLHLVNH